MSLPPSQTPSGDVEGSSGAGLSSSLSSRRPPLEAIQTHRAQARHRPSRQSTTASFVSHSPTSQQQQQQQQQWEQHEQQQQQPLATSLPCHPSPPWPQQEPQPLPGQDAPHSSFPSSSLSLVPASSSSSSPLPLSLQPHIPATAPTVPDSASPPSTASPHVDTPGSGSFPFTPSTVVAAHSPTAALAAMEPFTGDAAETSSQHPPKHGDDHHDNHCNDPLNANPSLSPTPLHHPRPTSHDSMNEQISHFNASPAVGASLPATVHNPPASSSPSSSSPSPIASSSSVPGPPLSTSSSSSNASRRASPSQPSAPAPATAAADAPQQHDHRHSLSRSSPTHGRSQPPHSSTMLANLERRRGSGGTGHASGHHSLGHGKRGGSQHGFYPGGGHDEKGDTGGRQTTLPTLWQVLHRKTLPPVCLFNFYLYMRDFERSSEQVDFWLDVTTHEVLWRLYVRTLRRKEARERAEEQRQLAKEREEREMRAAAAAAAADRWQMEQEEATGAQSTSGKHKAHKSQSSMSLEMIKPHWTVAKRFLDMSQEERQEYGEQTGLRWEDVKDVMVERAKLEEAREQQIEQDRRRFGEETATEPRGSQRPLDAQDCQVVSLEVLDFDAHPQAHAQPRQNESASGGALHSKKSLDPILLADAPRASHPQHSQEILPKIDESPLQKRAQSPIGGPTAGPSEQALRPNSTSRSQSITSNAISGGSGAASSTTPHRGSTKGLSGMAVTREEVLKSAERIYLKYLTPQAEKHVHIPPSVRQRITALMDGYLMQPSPRQHQSPSRGGGVGLGHNGSKEDVRRPTSTTTPSPASTNRKEFKRGVGQGLEVDSRREKQGDNHTSNRGGGEETGHSKAMTLSSGHTKSGMMRASSSGMGRPLSPRGSFTLPQPDQDLGLLFAEARESVFDTMERYYFPRFLRARAYGNMVHLQRVFRLFLGLFLLFLGFTTVLCLIFLNAQPRSKRAWALIPIFSGVMLCTTFQFNICPVLAALNLSENKLMRFAKNKEPYIIRLHRRRALKVVIVAILYTACLSIVFGLVPGHRL